MCLWSTGKKVCLFFLLLNLSSQLKCEWAEPSVHVFLAKRMNDKRWTAYRNLGNLVYQMLELTDTEQPQWTSTCAHFSYSQSRMAKVCKVPIKTKMLSSWDWVSKPIEVRNPVWPIRTHCLCSRSTSDATDRQQWALSPINWHRGEDTTPFSLWDHWQFVEYANQSRSPSAIGQFRFWSKRMWLAVSVTQWKKKKD